MSEQIACVWFIDEHLVLINAINAPMFGNILEAKQKLELQKL